MNKEYSWTENQTDDIWYPSFYHIQPLADSVIIPELEE